MGRTLRLEYPGALCQMINANAMQPPSSTLDDSLHSLSVSMLELSYSAARNADNTRSADAQVFNGPAVKVLDMFICIVCIYTIY